ncbi:unnamed protein product [Rotaria sp. Silwood1]|nr:unnamed protein product [Rotaria sp. Silwood1]CAF3794436.1 unnamed protein product [Rotaria sp. Silwood1]
MPVLRWNSTGITVAGITNNSGNADNQLNFPTDVKLDYEHNLYIVDSNNHRIQKYLFGALTGQTVAGNGTSGSSQYQLSYPLTMMIDSNENLYISDTSNARVQYWPKGAVSGTTIADTTALTKAGNNRKLTEAFNTQTATKIHMTRSQTKQVTSIKTD